MQLITAMMIAFSLFFAPALSASSQDGARPALLLYTSQSVPIEVDIGIGSDMAKAVSCCDGSAIRLLRGIDTIQNYLPAIGSAIAGTQQAEAFAVRFDHQLISYLPSDTYAPAIILAECTGARVSYSSCRPLMARIGAGGLSSFLQSGIEMGIPWAEQLYLEMTDDPR